MNASSVPDPPCATEACAVLVAQLVSAIDGRDTIGMAKGILMQAEGIDPDEAFELLAAASMRENRKVREIAADLVARHRHLAHARTTTSRARLPTPPAALPSGRLVGCPQGRLLSW